MTRSSAAGRTWAGVRRAARQAKQSTAGRLVATIGLGSRAIVYGALSAIVCELALVRHRRETDQGSALATLGRVPGVRYSSWRSSPGSPATRCAVRLPGGVGARR